MTDETAKLSLLPNGFVDLLPPRAEGEAHSISMLMEKFKAFGYERVKPPMLEFEDSLIGASTAGAKLASETFRLMDPVSHRMIGIRSDITPQIARIATSRMGGEPRPLRLTYANDALRTRAGQMRTERQFTQVGCEIIGDDGADTDIEICVLAVLGLKALGLGGITLDLNIPQFVTRLTRGVEGVALAQVQKAVAQRDQDALGKIMPVLAEVMAKGRTPDGLRSLVFDPDMSADIQHLCRVYDGVKQALGQLGVTDVALSIDVLELAGFEYHKRLGFTVFAAGVHGELGRGGCYDVRFGNAHETAKGFTLYMDTVGKAVPLHAQPDKVFVPSDASWAEIDELQKSGWIVVRGTGAGIAGYDCTHEYKNGQIIKLKKEKS